MSALADQIAEVLRGHRRVYRDDYECACGHDEVIGNEDGERGYWPDYDDLDHEAHMAERIAELFTEETQQLADGMGGVTTNWKTGETTHHFRPCTRLRRFVSPWTTEETKP